MLNNELISFLFDGKSRPFSETMSQWLASSRRFAAFVDTFRDKIRKKIRVTQAAEGQLDLQLELETAYLLLKEKTLSVMYEPDHAKRISRAPDFAVTYTTSLTFMLEVLIGMDPLALMESDLRDAMRHIQRRAEQGDPTFLGRYGFRDRADFLGHYQRLSEVLLRGPDSFAPAVWVNSQAKHVLPSKVRTALYRSHTSSSSS
jgi:hypothetical protein